MKSIKECIAHALAGVQPIPKEFLELDGVDKNAELTAPYIDAYANNLTVASNKLCSHPETGRLCILLKVSKFDRNTTNYNTYTSDGLIREVLDSDGDKTRSVIYDVDSEVLLCDIT